MRNLEDIEKDLAAAREALLSVEGTPAEVYSRIVGYYRSVRNWNRGKREEYGERQLYKTVSAAAPSPSLSGTLNEAERSSAAEHRSAADLRSARLMLFVRSSCPGCKPARAAAGQLGIPVELVNADSTEGIAEALRRNVLSTPTAILLSPAGEELKRARDAQTIGGLLDTGTRTAIPAAV